jgi:hypothetical protein
MFVPSNLKHYAVTSLMHPDPAHPGVEFIDIEERDGPCTRGCEPPPPSPEKDIFMLLARPDIHLIYTGIANAEVEFIDVNATSPFYHFVLDQMRQAPQNFIFFAFQLSELGARPLFAVKSYANLKASPNDFRDSYPRLLIHWSMPISILGSIFSTVCARKHGPEFVTTPR